MKYVLLLGFLFPSFSFAAMSVNLATSTPKIGVVLTGVPAVSVSSVVRLFTPNLINTTPNTSCHTFINNAANPTAVEFVLDYDFFLNNSTQCRPVQYGTYTVSRYSSATSTTPLETVSFTFVQDTFDHKSLIVLIFLVGAMLAIFRPLISSLLVRS